MITCCIVFIFGGSFFLYHTSKKALLQQNLLIEKWVTQNRVASKIMGLFFYLIAFLIAIIAFGKTSGILFFLSSLMLILGLVVIISPIKKGLYKPVSIMFLIFFIIELLF